MCAVIDRRWKQSGFFLSLFDSEWWVLQNFLLKLSLCGGPWIPPASGKWYHLCVQQLKVYSPWKACLLASRSLMSSFTCVWSSVAGREAHMHFTSTLVILGLVRIRVYWPIHNLTSHWYGWDLLFLPIIPCIYSSILKQISVFILLARYDIGPPGEQCVLPRHRVCSAREKLQRAYSVHLASKYPRSKSDWATWICWCCCQGVFFQCRTKSWSQMKRIKKQQQTNKKL